VVKGPSDVMVGGTHAGRSRVSPSSSLLLRVRAQDRHCRSTGPHRGHQQHRGLRLEWAHGQHRWHVHSPKLLSRTCRAKTESGEDMTPTMFTSARRAGRLAEVLLGYLEAAGVLPWPGGDGLTLDDVLRSYPGAATEGLVPDRAARPGLLPALQLDKRPNARIWRPNDAGHCDLQCLLGSQAGIVPRLGDHALAPSCTPICSPCVARWRSLFLTAFPGYLSNTRHHP
jgi:hypothetical protein